MASEWVTDPRMILLDDRFGWAVGQTRLRGSWYRRALILMAAADKYGGVDSDGFVSWHAGASENWRFPDEIIMRALSEVPAEPDDANT